MLKNKEANIYYYNKKTKKFEIINLNTEYNDDGYYEFYINHNSKYVISSNTINEKYISNNKSSTSDANIKTILMITIPSVIIIILLLIIIMLLKNKKVVNKES